MEEIRDFLANTIELKKLLQITKGTDSYYLRKRDITKDYNPVGSYDFDAWRHTVNSEIKKFTKACIRTCFIQMRNRSFRKL